MGQDRRKQRSGAKVAGAKKTPVRDGPSKLGASAGGLRDRTVLTKVPSSPGKGRTPGSSARPNKTRDPTPSIMDLTIKSTPLSKKDELELLKRAYLIKKDPSGPEIRHLSLIMGRSPGTIRAWFDAHKPVQTRDAVDRELQTALEGFDYLDSSCSDDGEDDDSDLSTVSDDELLTPQNPIIALPDVSRIDVKSKSPNKANGKAPTGSATASSAPGPGIPSRQASSPPSQPGRTSSGRSLIDGNKKLALETHFAKDPNPSMEARTMLAQKVRIDVHRVSQWFAMRRFRLRRASEESNKSIEVIDVDRAEAHNADDGHGPRPIPPNAEQQKANTFVRTSSSVRTNTRSASTKIRKEPSSTSSNMDAPPRKKTRFLASTPAKSRSSRARHAPRKFFPAVDWNAPPPPNDRTPRFTFWFAKERTASSAAETSHASVPVPSKDETLPELTVHPSAAASPSAPATNTSTPDVVRCSPTDPGQMAPSLAGLSSASSRPVGFAAQVEAHVSRALQGTDGLYPRSSSSDERAVGALLSLSHANPASSSSLNTLMTSSHSKSISPQARMNSSASSSTRPPHQGLGRASVAYIPTRIVPTARQLSPHHSVHSLSSSHVHQPSRPNSSSSIGNGARYPAAQWVYPTQNNTTTSIPSNSSTWPSFPGSSTSTFRQPSASTAMTSQMVHNSLVNSAMSKLDTIAAIARMRVIASPNARR